MASIRERSEGVWEVRSFVGRDGRGRPIQVSRTVRGGKRDAQRVAAELVVKPATRSGRQNVAELLRYWQDLRGPSWSPLTARAHASRSRSIAEDPIASLAVGRLQVADIDAWVARMRKRGVGEGSIRNQLQTMRAALTQAQRWGWITQNPAALAHKDAPKRTPRGVLRDDEVAALLEAAEAQHGMAHLAIRLAAVTGARRGELAALQWADLSGRVLRIDSALVAVRHGDGDDAWTEVLDTPTKTADLRAVTLDPDTVALFEAQRAERAQAGPWVFGDDDAPPHPGRVGYWWKLAKERSGIAPTWRLHDLRHWSATHGVSNGFDMATVGGRLGHSDASTTLRIYAHTQSREDARLADSIGATLRRPRTV